MRVFEEEEPMRYTYYPEESPTTPTDIVGTFRSDSQTFLLSVFKGLFSFDGKFRSFLNDNTWNEKKLRHIVNYKKGFAISQEFGDIYIVSAGKEFKVLTKILRKDFKGNTILGLASYSDWLIIITEQGITFTDFKKQIFVDDEQGLRHPVYAAHVFQDKLYTATDKGEFRINLKQLLDSKQRLSSLFIKEFKVNNNPISAIKDLKLASNKNHIQIGVGTNSHPFPGKLRFQYKIREEAAWHEMANQRAELSFLEPANYELHIRVTDESTGQILEKRILDFTILPPFYMRWWFFLIAGFSFVALVMAIFYVKKHRQEKAAQKEIAFNKQIEKLKTDALLAQMNPHFIFNALNSIQHLIVMEENDKASEYLLKFASLVRTNLNNAGRTYVTLKEELDYLKTYCDIENERHGNRIAIIFDLDPAIDLSEEQIPSMVLQPFIENAFVHAFPPSIENPELTLSILLLPDRTIQYSIRDNGVGIQEKKRASFHISKGQTLVKERLRFLGHETEKILEISTGETGTLVVLTL